jgi:hypothetical protein
MGLPACATRFMCWMMAVRFLIFWHRRKVHRRLCTDAFGCVAVQRPWPGDCSVGRSGGQHTSLEFCFAKNLIRRVLLKRLGPVACKNRGQGTTLFAVCVLFFKGIVGCRSRFAGCDWHWYIAKGSATEIAAHGSLPESTAIQITACITRQPTKDQ